MKQIEYWHMQMFPGGNPEFAAKIPKILEHHKIIGLGDWEEKGSQISDFKNKMKVNDVVAIKTGAKLIALVQIVGGAYEVPNDKSELGWIYHRRPIRILDWALEHKTIPQPRGTLNRCANADAQTTKIIKEWHDRVKKSFEERSIPQTV